MAPTESGAPPGPPKAPPPGSDAKLLAQTFPLQDVEAAARMIASENLMLSNEDELTSSPCYTQHMGASFPGIYSWLPLQLGLRPATARPRHLKVLAGDEEPVFTPPVLHLGANALGVHLLQATDEADLEIRLDEALANPMLSRVLSLMIPEIGAPLPTDQQAVPDLDSVLPEEQLERFAEMEPLLEEWLRLCRAFRSLQGSGGRPVARLDPEAALIDALYDPALPPAVAMLALESLRGHTAMLGLIAAAVRQTPLVPWLAAALTDYAVAGAKASVRILASIPELGASPEVLPPEQRIPFEALASRTQQAERGAQMLTLLIEAQGDHPCTPWPQTPDLAAKK